MFLCACRKGYATTLLKLLAGWKNDLDKIMYAAVMLMDLKKTFVCLPC